jgi:hypothetical protein
LAGAAGGGAVVSKHLRGLLAGRCLRGLVEEHLRIGADEVLAAQAVDS